MGFHLPHKANVGEIVRVKGYDGKLFLVLEYTEEIAHDENGVEEVVTYTMQDIDNPQGIKIIFDQDVTSIVVTADNAEEFLANRQGTAQPPAIREQDKPKSNIGDSQIDIQSLLKMYEEEKQKREQSANKKTNNEPRSKWQKEREAKRKAYEYIDFLLERYTNLMTWRAVHSDDAEALAEIDMEIEMIRTEFKEKTGEDVVQDGKFS